MTPVSSLLTCERVRSQISLALDAELSELERRMLDGHLARCSTCSEFDRSTRAFTTQLRAAPLEPLRRLVVVERRRRSPISVAQAAAAAVAAFVAVGIAGQLDSQGGSTRAETQKASLFISSWQPEWEVAQLGKQVAAVHEDMPGPVYAL